MVQHVGVPQTSTRPPTRPAVALALLGLAVLVGLALFWAGAGASGSTSAPAASSSATPSTAPASNPASNPGSKAAQPADAPLRAKAERVLAEVDATGRPPKGYVGGRQFMNDGRGGTAPLPPADARGRPVSYHEYDVNPYREGVNRGPQRLVVGSDGSAFCTGDHYVTWSRLR
jgi:guanyl-specific ribonuclease Sa